MRFLSLAVSAVLAFLTASCATQPTAAPAAATPAGDAIFNLPYQMRDLPNGLRVIVVRTPYPDIITLQIPVQTGSRNEVEPGKSGFAHFFEHMMFRGTEKVPADRYTEILKVAGADSNAYTSDDLTNYHTTFAKADLETILEVEADRFQNLRYTEEQFRTEAQAVKGEYLKNYANPNLKMFERLRDMAFDRHPYEHTTIGFLKDIEDMPNQLEYSRVFFDRWYRPEKTTLILAGDVDADVAFRLVEKHWGGWKRGQFGVEIPQEPAPQGPGYEHLKWDAPTQPLVTFAFRGPAFDPKDKALPSLQLLGEIFFSNTSDVYQKVVNQERWADTLFYWFPERKDPGLLLIGARINKPEDARKVADALLDALVRARLEAVSSQKLADIKSNLKYAFAASLDNSQHIGDALASFVHFERTPETINTYYRTFDALTAADLLTAANRYFVDAGRFTVTVSNSESLPGFAALPSLDGKVAELKALSAAGLAKVLQPSNSPLVDVMFLFHQGAAQDPPGKKGLAALTAAMVAEGGSATRTIRELNEARFPLAAPFTVQVDKEMTRFGGTVHRDNADAWRRLALEQLLTPGWREDDFKRLQQQQINAIRTDLRSNNDEELGKEALYAEIYGAGHPYGSLTLGRIGDVEKLTLADVKAFYAKYYTPANLTLGLAGGYGEAFAQQVERDLARLPAGAHQAIHVPPVALPPGRRATIVQKETQSVAVSFGWPIALRRTDPDWIALWLARSWLGEHRSSNGRLMERIREVRGLNYGDYAYDEYFPRGMYQFKPDPNLGRQQQIFQIWLRPLRSNNDAVFATRAALFELRNLVDKGLSEQEFEATRRFLDKYVSQLVDTQWRQLGYALDSRYYGIPPFTDYVREGLRKLKVEDVNRVIRKHLQADAVQFVFVAKDAADLRRRLGSDAPSPIQYNSPKPQELLDEDARIAALPLKLPARAITIRRLEDVFR